MSEKGEVKRDGARATSNSGRGHYQKGDAILDIFTIDYKEYSKSFSISKEVWAKVSMDAIRNNRTEPALKVILGSGNNKTRLAVVSWEIMEDYIRLRKEEEIRLNDFVVEDMAGNAVAGFNDVETQSWEDEGGRWNGG